MDLTKVFVVITSSTKTGRCASTIKRRKMQWFGLVNRSTGLAKLIMQGSVEGKRERGRPRTAWLDNIRA